MHDIIPKDHEGLTGPRKLHRAYGGSVRSDNDSRPSLARAAILQFTRILPDRNMGPSYEKYMVEVIKE